MSDIYLETCVICEQLPCVADSDACSDDECQTTLADGANFGRCYLCRDSDHAHCIGVPCQCPCPTPDVIERQAQRDAALAKLTPAERQVLGF